MHRWPTLAALGLAALTCTLASAAEFPSKPLRWIVPYAPGGASDTLTRALAEAVRENVKQPVLIDNRPGAATNIGVQTLLQAKADGYTVMSAENAALFFNEHMFGKLPYKPAADFTFVAGIGRIPVAMVVHPDFPARNLAEFVAYVKANPGQVNYASPGIGTSHHMAMEMFARQAGLKVTHVVYKGGAAAIADVVSGQVPVMMLDLTVGHQYIRSNKVRPIAVASVGRIPALRDVPSFTEAGYQGVSAYTVHGVIGPAGMPRDAVDTLHAAVQRAVRAPRVQALLENTGFEPLDGRPDEFRDYARKESARWGEVIKATGLKLD